MISNTYGHIVLANNKSGFVPAAIKWMTNSEFSHSFIIIPDILGIPMCIEAAANGVDTCRFDTGYANDPNEAYEVWMIKIPQETKDKAIISILNDLEILYGIDQFLWFIWRKINMMRGKDIKDQNNWFQDGMICSQLCVAYLKACGLEYVLKGYGSGSVSPQDLKNIFIAYPDVFELIETKQ